jgi:hypothetical protein
MWAKLTDLPAPRLKERLSEASIEYGRIFTTPQGASTQSSQSAIICNTPN